MILADKIIMMRKKAGWSQEELAGQLGVTRQAVSKWEGAQSTPDLDKVLKMSRLFGVSTDYLLKDELEQEEFVEAPAEDDARHVTMEEANEFLRINGESSGKVALGTVLCILSPVCLIMLAGMTEVKAWSVPENLAVGLGMIILLVMVTAAVNLFIACTNRSKRFEYIQKEPVELEYGVAGMVRERMRQYEPVHDRDNAVGVSLSILSVAALFAGICLTEEDFLLVIALCLMLVMLAAGVYFFVRTGTVWGGFEALLEEGEYDKRSKAMSGRRSVVSVCYWLVATAIFLGYSFAIGDWENSWIVWPVAGVLYAALMVVMSQIWKRDK